MKSICFYAGIYLRFLWILICHKWFVFVKCWELGIPWQGIVHDLSKLRPDEASAYARHQESNVETDDFRLAFLRHQRRNPHHWQWWILTDERGESQALPMPDVYRREMIADWYGASIIKKGLPPKEWYKKKGHNLQLHPTTRHWVEQQLGIIDEQDQSLPKLVVRYRTARDRYELISFGGNIEEKQRCIKEMEETGKRLNEARDSIFQARPKPGRPQLFRPGLAG